MIGFELLSAAFLLSFACAQILNPPGNVSSGYVEPSGPQALAFTSSVSDNAQQISWFFTPNGFAVVDSDIIYGRIEDFNRAVINITYNSESDLNTAGASANATAPARRRSVVPPAPHAVKRANSVFPGSSGLWPDGNILYRYADQATEDALSFYTEGAINAWQEAVPCLNFTKLPNGVDGSDPIVTIYANIPNQGYCLASLGFSPFGTFMSLDTGGGCGVPELIHEWGHILGLYHEQKRPDSFAKNPFQCQNLIDYPFGILTAEADANCCGKEPNYGCCGWACQFTPQFDLYNIQDPVNGEYDFDSIMLYRNDAFAKPGTLTLLNGPNTFSNPQQLSAGDINRIKALYGCPQPPKCPKGCDPTSGQNKCSFPTAPVCIYPSPSTPNPRAACACRAGYKATTSGIPDNDTTKQWRLPAPEGNFRVWVAEGVACDTLCDTPTGTESCREVAELPEACLRN
ncbi:hypothetical protein GJ744_007457 [Endocarpon pusillum]|uniref:Peptidase M12A domain-containing protein n=1 Tax=Endocarpon pusillum TaxID=364733 RepID=A0A8H7AKQ7_9EURO|nr:hypothetical protein GJ744_007457 [Endocarpon pusillum]